MKQALFILAMLFFVTAKPADAVIMADSADDVCAPTEDPCVISEPVEVLATLDFGLRTVRVTGAGRLDGSPDIVIFCGEFIVDVGGGTPSPVISAPGGYGSAIEITIRRACSGDGVTPCLDDQACASLSLGSCSVGGGAAHIDGRVSAVGQSAGSITIRAVGDITIETPVTASATGVAETGGEIELESTGGSVILNGSLKANPGVGQYYGDVGNGGSVEIHAALDVVLADLIDVSGGGGGGYVTIHVGRDFSASAGIKGDAGQGSWAHGGDISVYADGDITMVPSGGQLATRFQTDGGGNCHFYYYGNECYWHSGYGGYQNLYAQNVSIAQNVIIQSQGGPGYGPGGGIYVTAYGLLTLDGQILAQPVGPAGGHGGAITLRADGGIDIGSAGEVLVQGAYGGSTSVYSEGPVSFYGKIDARGTGFSSFGYDFGRGGYVTIGGRQDLKLGGMINSGGLKGADGDVNIDVCRLSMTASGRIDADFAGPTPHNPDVNITVHESMTTHANSSIFADKAGARNLITYRDPNKPPVLDGIIDPPPILNVNPSLVGCPVCGNSEIDQDESCDDGNMTSGDGCRSDCQDEGCIAATPGFPSTPLCDDGDACTADRCDPVAHACQNPVSCEEGVVCTVDACVAGACQHTPEDGLCDDANDCTDDLCNATTGCVHADLTGGSCEDGDYCTEAGACDDGDCIITDLSLATGNRLKVSLKTGPTNDVLKAIVNLPLAEFSANPATTGLRIVLVDSADQSIYEDDLPAAGWVDSGGAGRAFGYKDEVGAVRTVAKIKRNAATGLARSVVKVSGAEMPGASSQEALSLSLLFGTDPAIDECLTARRVPCTPKATSTSCRDD